MGLDFEQREVPAQLRERYLREGMWAGQTLGELLAQRAEEVPDLRVQVFSDQRPYDGTFAEVFDLARRFAAGLRERGIGPGDVVAFQMPNWHVAAVTFYGAAFLGAVVVPIVHIYGMKEVGYILRQSGARAFVTVDQFFHPYAQMVADVRDELPELEHLIVSGQQRPEASTDFDQLLSAGPLGQPVHVDPDEVAMIAYTSGTTADPKGVVHSHRTTTAEVVQLSTLQPEDELPQLVASPVSHAIGMLSGLLLPVYRGRPIALIDTWDPGWVLDLMVEHDLTAGSGASFFLATLLDHPNFGEQHVERMPYIGLGGAPVPPALAERADGLGISLIRSYGSTEHPSVTSSFHDEPRESRLFTDGSAMVGCEIRIVGPEGEQLGPGEAGQIVSRGPELCVGYTDPTLTDEAFDADGWYRTGDVGFLDEAGNLTITDRVKDLIIRGGENVSPAEVEDLIVRMPEVAEVAVVAAPDERFGERGCVILRLQPEASAVTLEDVRRHLDHSGIAKQKWPEELRIVDDLPRTATGKIQKFTLREQLRTEVT